MAGLTVPGKSPSPKNKNEVDARAGSNPSVAAILAALKTCSKSRDGATGEKIHAAARANGSIKNSFVASSLIDMYANCGRIDDAAKIFDEMEGHTVVSWNCLILGYAENKQPRRSLQLFDRMLREATNFAPNHITFIAALKACSALAKEEHPRLVEGDLVKIDTLEKVMSIHSRARSGSSTQEQELHIFLANFLIDVYSRCGSPDDSRSVFDRIKQRSVVSWTSMILCYADNDRGDLGLELFEEMDRAGCSMNQVTFIAAIKSCSSIAERDPGAVVGGRSIKLRSLEIGRDLHSRAKVAGFSKGLVIANTLIDMYSKCRSMEDSIRVFDAMEERCVVSWTGMILGYAQNGDGGLALEFFRKMDCRPNYVTVLAAIRACVTLAEAETGTMIRDKMVKTSSLEIARSLDLRARDGGFENEIFVANAILDMYSKCGSLDDAFRVFWSIRDRDSVSWSSIIQGCAENGDDEQALELFAAMRGNNIAPNPAGFVAAIRSCGNLGDLDRARALELEVSIAGFAEVPIVVNSLIVLYGRCGSTAGARRVFDSCPPHSRDLVTWNAMVDAYGRHGDAAQVLAMFNAMARSHDRTLWPNSVTFLLALSACCHGGLVDESKRLLTWMIQENRVAPSIKHYTCVIDLLGRANRLEEAVELVERLPIEADSVVWTSLMDAARRWGDERVAKRAFDAATKLESRSAAYVMMSSIVADQEP